MKSTFRKTIATVLSIIYLAGLTPLYAEETSDDDVTRWVESTREAIAEADEVRSVKVLVSASEGGEVKLGKAGIIVPAGALREDTVIEIVRLGSVEETGESLYNATSGPNGEAGSGGYRFLPEGLRFQKKATIRLPYDTKLNASEGRLEELSSYYYDTERHQWLVLEKKGCSKEEGVVESYTTHFTDMINATLSLPESPSPVDININSIKNLEAANPGSGVIQLKGLEGDTNGGASFSMELAVPQGRGGMTPRVALTYSSAGGSGLAGKGFDIDAASVIGTDTRKGLPEYKGDDRYTVDGVLLKKRSEEGGEVKKYGAERETRYADIEYRYGSGNYWVVREKDGVEKIYGQRADTWSGTGEGKKYRWYIESEVDVNGNRIEWEYEKNGSGAVYVKEIRYGNAGSGIWAYSVVFEYEGRDDVRSDGRGGWIEESDRRVKRIETRVLGRVIKVYEAEYDEGLAKQSFLTRFTVKSGSGEEEYGYRFEYEDVEYDGEGNAIFFGSPEKWQEGKPLQVTNGVSGGFQASGNIAAGYGFRDIVDVRASGGGQISGSNGSSYSDYTLVDINGDGRPDSVRQTWSNRIAVAYNTGHGFASEVYIDLPYDIEDLEGETNTNNSYGWNVYGGAGTKFGIGAGVTYSEVTQKSESKMKQSFMDADGDGLSDIVETGKTTYLKNMGADAVTGEVRFEKRSLAREGGAGIADANEKVSAEEKGKYFEEYYVQTPFRSWRAPYEGEVRIEQKLTAGEGVIARMYAGVDEKERVNISAASGSGGTGTSSVSEAVSEGSYLYFISDAGVDTREKDIEWNVRIGYERVKPFESRSGKRVFLPRRSYAGSLGLASGPDESAPSSDSVYRGLGIDVRLQSLYAVSSSQYGNEGKWYWRGTGQLKPGYEVGTEAAAALDEKGEYLPVSYEKETFERIAERIAKEVNRGGVLSGAEEETLSVLAAAYTYDAVKGRYRLKDERDSELNRKVWALLSDAERRAGLIGEEVCYGDVTIRPEWKGSGVVYSFEGGKHPVAGGRGAGSEGVTGKKGKTLTLGRVGERTAEIRKGSDGEWGFYVDGRIDGATSVSYEDGTIRLEDEKYIIEIRYSGRSESAYEISEEERTDIRNDVLFEKSWASAEADVWRGNKNREELEGMKREYGTYAEGAEWERYMSLVYEFVEEDGGEGSVAAEYYRYRDDMSDAERDESQAILERWTEREFDLKDFRYYVKRGDLYELGSEWRSDKYTWKADEIEGKPVNETAGLTDRQIAGYAEKRAETIVRSASVATILKYKDSIESMKNEKEDTLRTKSIAELDTYIEEIEKALKVDAGRERDGLAAAGYDAILDSLEYTGDRGTTAGEKEDIFKRELVSYFEFRRCRSVVLYVSTEYGLGKYGEAEKRIEYKRSGTYEATGGDIRVLVLKEGNLESVSVHVGTWDSGKDFSVETRTQGYEYSRALIAGEGGEDSGEPVEVSYRVNAEESLYGGENAWYYGIWVGQQSRDADVAMKLNPFRAAVLGEAREASGMSEAEYEKKKTEAESGAENMKENPEGAARGEEQKYYAVSPLGKDGSEGITGEDESGVKFDGGSGVLTGSVTRSVKSELVWESSGKRTAKSVEATYFPYIEGDVIHANRKGGVAVWELPGMGESTPDSFSMVTLRSVTSSGMDKTTSGTVVWLGISSGVNDSESRMTQSVQDVNGDGVADIVQACGNELVVTEGQWNEKAGRVEYGRQYVLGGVGEVNRNVSEIRVTGASVSPCGSVTVERTAFGKVTGTTFNGSPVNDGASIQNRSLPSGSSSIGGNRQESGFLDVNGDGLPDYYTGGRFLMNAGGVLTGGYAGHVMSGGMVESRSESVSGNGSTGVSVPPGKEGSGGGLLVGSQIGSGVSVGAGINYSSSVSNNEKSLMDVNGDGLADIVRKSAVSGDEYVYVQFNTGKGFLAEQKAKLPKWNIGPEEQASYMLSSDGNIFKDTLKGLPIIGDMFNWSVDTGVALNLFDLSKYANALEMTTSMNIGVNGNLNVSFNASIAIWATFIYLGSVNIGGTMSEGVNAGISLSGASVKMLDMDGDGLSDHVLRIPGDKGGVWVKRNLAGRYGLLKAIEVPQGGRYEIGYRFKAGDGQSGGGRYVMNEVTKDDGCGRDGRREIEHGVHRYAVRYDYDYGYYDRIRKEFYGYAHVTAEYADGSKRVSEYWNDEYYRKGMTKRVTIYDRDGEKKRSDSYEVDVSPYARVVRSEAVSYDGNAESGVVTEYGDFDEWGNIGLIREKPVRGGGGYELEGVIRYASFGGNRYLHNHPESIEVYVYDKDGMKGMSPARRREGRYDSQGRLIDLRQYYSGSGYASYEYGYDRYGNMMRVTGPGGEALEYRYDGEVNQYPVEISQSGSGTERYVSAMEWDVYFGVKTGEEDANGNRMSYAYDERGRLVGVRSPRDGAGAVGAVEYEYHTEEGSPWYAVTKNKITFDPADSAVMETVIEIDGLGRVTQSAKRGERREGDGSRVLGWNVSGQVEYDGKGRSIAEGQNDFVEGESVADLLMNAPYRLRNASYKEYDSLDRVVEVRIPDHTLENGYAIQRVAYGIDDEGNSYTETSDPLGNVSVQVQDGRGNVVRVERLDGNGKRLTEARYEYNALGEMLASYDAAGNPVSVTYDMLGRRTSLESLDGGKKEYWYDESGNLIRESDSVLRKKGKEIRYEYDGLNRLVRIDYPESDDVVYTYGGASAEYNRAGRVVTMSDETGRVEYKYGALGEVVEETRSIRRLSRSGGEEKSAAMRYESDYLGRMQSIVYPDGEEVRYGYDRGGQVCSVIGVKQGVEFVYVADIGYDEYGQRTYMEYGNGVKTNYTYDEDRRWLSNIKTGIAGLTYQDMDYSFDAVGNVAGYVNDADGYRTEQHYEYDGLYQLTGVEGISVNRPSGYDQYRAEYRQRYTFDELGLGNMMRKESESTVRPAYDLKGDELNYLLEYEYDAKAAHRVTRIGERFYRYDGNGNVVEEVSANSEGETELDTAVYEEGEGVYRSDYGWAERNPDVSSGGSGGGTKGYRRSYIWNERNLMSQSADSRYTVTYRYGSDGQRATKYARGMNESETMYFSKMWEWRYDEAAGGRERNSKHIFLGETRVVTKVLADASVVAGERESEYFYHSDHLGSAQLISDYEGREYERIEYTPYGETWVDRKEAVDTIELTYRFTGKEVDEETGLYYYGARYLDPRTSRWLSADPALGEYIPGAPVDEEAKKANQNLPGMGGVFNVVNFQLYHYAGNNPVKYVDPDGRTSSDIKTVIFVIRHPVIAQKIGAFKSGSNNISTNATRFQWELPLDNKQTEGSSGNAFRHALWQATIRSEFGFDIALQAGEAHESGSTDTNASWFVNKTFLSLSEADRVCDLNNNKIGRMIGATNIGKEMNELAKDVLKMQYEYGLFEAIQNGDGSFRVERVKITEESYIQGLNRLNQLDENGR